MSTESKAQQISVELKRADTGATPDSITGKQSMECTKNCRFEGGSPQGTEENIKIRMIISDNSLFKELIGFMNHTRFKDLQLRFYPIFFHFQGKLLDHRGAINRLLRDKIERADRQ